MPQLDKFIFLSQLLWLVLLLGGGYLLLVKRVLPSVLRTLKFRRLLLRNPFSSRPLDRSPSDLPSLQPISTPSSSPLFPLGLLPLDGEEGLLFPPSTPCLSVARRWNLLLRLQLEEGQPCTSLPVWSVERIGVWTGPLPSVRTGGGATATAGWEEPTPLLPVAGRRGVDRLAERTPSIR